MVKINGEEKDVAGISVAKFLEDNNYDVARVVVEVNFDIIPKNEYDTYMFKDEDSVEVVSFVGGG